MKTVDIHEAKTHLSRLIEQAVKGESFIIAKEDKPLVRVSAIETGEPVPKRRPGFLAGQGEVPDDFDSMGRNEIETMFRAEGLVLPTADGVLAGYGDPVRTV